MTGDWCHREIQKTERGANLGGEKGTWKIKNYLLNLRLLIYAKVEMLSREVAVGV